MVVFDYRQIETSHRSRSVDVCAAASVRLARRSARSKHLEHRNITGNEAPAERSVIGVQGVEPTVAQLSSSRRW